jgi:DNA-binding NtrC family response regulator
MLRPELSAPRTLIADDQPDVLEALRLLLKREGYQIEAVNSPKAVLDRLHDREYDVLLMDLNYALDTTSGQEGLDLLASVQKLDRTLPVVVMTAWGSIKLAVEAMQRGAADFVEKPWDNSKLLSTLRTQWKRATNVAMARPASRAKSKPPAPRNAGFCRNRSRNSRATESRRRGVRPGRSAAIIWTCCGWTPTIWRCAWPM